jgi:hypothetical protein
MAIMNGWWNNISPGRPKNIVFRVGMRHTVHNLLVTEQNAVPILFFVPSSPTSAVFFVFFGQN